MGNEQSSESSREDEERKHHEISAAKHAELNRKLDEEKKKFLESRAKAIEHSSQQSPHVEQQTGPTNDHPAKLAERIRVETASTSNYSEPSSPATSEPTGDSILQAFNPRKEPRSKGDTAKPDNAASKPAKRPAPTLNAYADERRPSISNSPKIPKRTSMASPQSPGRAEADPLTTVSNERPPKWYMELDLKKCKRRGHDSNADTLLGSLRTQIGKCQTAARNGNVPKEIFHQIRDKLHKIVFIEVNGELLKSNRMLHDEGGLPQLFDIRYSKGVEWPYDVKADAQELYNKVCRRCLAAYPISSKF